METRLIFYKKRRFKKIMKLTSLLAIVTFFTFSLLIIRLLPGTYSNFSAETQSTGTIQNASSSDLIAVNIEKIKYEKNCKIKSSISIKNISTINIPLTVELLTKNGGNHSSSTNLEPNSTFSTNPNDVDNLSNRCETKEIKYRIIGFNGYIDEIYTLPVDHQKLAASKENNGNEQTLTISQDIIGKTEPQNSVIDQKEENKVVLPGNESAQNNSDVVGPPSLDSGDQVNP
jgi:hypothetical protein